MAKVKLKIKNGKITQEVEGIRGKRCVDLSDGLVALFGTETDKKIKPQFYDEIEQVEQQIDN